MTDLNHDPLTTGLAALAASPPPSLIDRVAARWVRVPGPLGPMYVASTDRGIARVSTAEDQDEFVRSFHERFGRPLLPGRRPPAGLLPALRTGHAAGLAYDLRGTTEFGQAVLRAALRIPRGQVRPYAWIAAAIGRPGAVRAVGTQLRLNPVPVLIPCHRVVRSDGAIGEYALGAGNKRVLLDAEGVDVEEVLALAAHGVHYLASDTTGIVCFPTCPYARRVTSRHRLGFRTVAGAAAAGYRPCLHCRPA
jgi:O-6-methylguanine DNA methyltransferase